MFVNVDVNNLTTKYMNIDNVNNAFHNAFISKKSYPNYILIHFVHKTELLKEGRYTVINMTPEGSFIFKGAILVFTDTVDENEVICTFL